MYQLSQQNIILSQQSALVPGADMIDARTERDRLWFLSSFAGLINYYNAEDKHQGNWAPFLLKDPVFLLAGMAKTNYNSFYQLYTGACLNIQQQLNKPIVLQSPPSGETTLYTPELVGLLVQLLDELETVLAHIGAWTYYMQLNDEEYPLKSYVINLVKSTFSPTFRAFRALRKQLLDMLPAVLRRDPAGDPGYTYLFTHLWENNKGSSAWWTILDMDDRPDFKKNSPSPAYLFDKIRDKADELFDFFKTVIAESGAAFDNMAARKSRYPDTTLLRTFVKLLQVQQQQLNTIPAKHLSFYYRDLLHQRPLPAKPDQAYLFASLLSTDTVFTVVKDTSFDAGVDEQNNPLLFSTTRDEKLNPAILTGVSTLAFDGNNGPLKLLGINDVNTLQYTETGISKSWNTFGGTGNAVKMGMSFGSPLLYLAEGIREIQVVIKFSQLYKSGILDGAVFYLSTKAGWLALLPAQLDITVLDVLIVESPLAPYTEARITITLKEEVPPIEAFEVNPDGLVCAWPMLKIEFDTIRHRELSPFIQWLKLKVHVYGLSNLLLYSDSGALSPKAPFTPFGPVPAQNSNFIIGSHEIFSKPFSALQVELYWDNLPGNMQDYYQAYNDNLAEFNCPSNDGNDQAAKKTPPPVTSEKKGNFFSRLWGRIKRFFGFGKKQTEEDKQDETDENTLPFNNCVFKTEFGYLQYGKWNSLPMTALPNQPGSPPVFTPCDPDGKLWSTCLPAGCEKLKDDPGEFLFRVICGGNTLADISAFQLEAQIKTGFVPDPALQQADLEYTDDSQSGFMRMSLSGPADGFGFAVYPKVVSNIALKNACILINKSGAPLVQPANPPLAPAAKLFKACYDATVDYDLCTQSGQYPLQCFLYSPFNTYKIFDNSPGSGVSSPETQVAVNGPVIDADGNRLYPCGVPLYPVFTNCGALFLSFSQMQSDEQLSVFFSFAAGNNIIQPGKKVLYTYLTAAGWKSLPVLTDETNNFSCTGIIRFNIPGDITSSSPLMPGNFYWISLATDDELALFPGTVYLNTNAFRVQRSGTDFLTLTQTPFIPAGIITQAYTPVPQLAEVIQPFASFGGKAAEDETAMNKRVSAAIKTRGRAVMPGDYYSLIRQQFAFVFYVKTVRTQKGGIVVYVVKGADGYEAPDAFLPFISGCQAEEIRQFLLGRVTGFLAADQPSANSLQVQNPDPVYIRVNISVTLRNGYEKARMKPLINQVIRIFLSPWIKTNQLQTTIGQPLQNAELADCVSRIAGVEAVTEITFTRIDPQFPVPCQLKNTDAEKEIYQDQPQQLFVSADEHCITFNHAA
jgi:hypothetical protein